MSENDSTKCKLKSKKKKINKKKKLSKKGRRKAGL